MCSVLVIIIINTLNDELIKLKAWVDINKLSQNSNTTEVILFGNYKENSGVGGHLPDAV